MDLDLIDLEFDKHEGPELARWIDRLRALVREHGRVRIQACPQMLAHTLYKAGLLRDGSIELVSVREEEPY